jgi:hypothetical protein
MVRVDKIGSDFQCLAERLAYTYIATYPEFIPLSGSDSNEED